MEKQCWGVVGLVVDNRRVAAVQIQELLTEYGDIIMGRMGVPMRDKHVCVISLIIDGESKYADELTKKLSALPGVHITQGFTSARPGEIESEAGRSAVGDANPATADHAREPMRV